MNSLRLSLCAVASACLLSTACAGGGSGGTGGTGNSGSAGSGAGGTNTGAAGTTGAGGTGQAGQTGTSGSGGTTGAAGQGSAGSGVAGNVAGTGGATGNAGTGGAPATGGSSGATGTGGSSGATGSAGRGGTAGSAAGTGGRGGQGGTAGGGGGTAGTGGSGAVSCASLPFCETFESGAVGQAPSTTNWTVINGAQAGNKATIDSMGAHGSSKSVKITTSSRFWLRNSSVIGTLGNVVHARFYVRFGTMMGDGHSALFSTDPQDNGQYNDQPQLRFGTQDQVFHWNTDTDAANIPETSPQGDAMSFKPAINTWYCIELTIDKMNGHLAASVDGQDIPGLAEDGTPTTYVDDKWIGSTASIMRYATLAEFNIGWVPFNGGPEMTLWFDDVALSSSTIGCN